MGVEGWVEVSPTEWKHVAIGNERLLKPQNVKVGKSNTPKGREGSGELGRASVSPGERNAVDEFRQRNTGASVLFVCVDDELAAVLALAGGYSFISDVRIFVELCYVVHFCTTQVKLKFL